MRPTPPLRIRGRTVIVLLALTAAVLTMLLLDEFGAPVQTELPDAVAQPPTVPPDADPSSLEPLRAIVMTTGTDKLELPALDHPHAFTLELRVVDRFGLPVPDSMVFVGPPECGLSLWPRLTDGKGTAHIEWRGRTPHMELVLALISNGVLQPLRWLACEADKPHPLVVVAQGRRQDPSQVEVAQNRSPERRRRMVESGRRELAERQRREGAADERGRLLEPGLREGNLERRDLLDVLCGRSLLLFQPFDCVVCHAKSTIAAYESLSRSREMFVSVHPAAVFWDQRTHDLDEEVLKTRKQKLDVSAEDKPEKDFKARNKARGLGEVKGVVLGPDGKPAEGVPVAWLDKDGNLNQRVLTGTGGGFQMSSMTRGMQTLVAGGGDQGSGRATTMIADYNTSQTELKLSADNPIIGVARDEEGHPLVGWRVEFESLDVPWADLATTREDGSFVLPTTPDKGRCLLWPKDDDLRLPVAMSPIVLPDGPPAVLGLDPVTPTRARLRIRAVLPPGFEHAQVEARVFQMETGRGTMLNRTGQDEHFELEGLAAGWYRVEVGAPILGWVTFGPMSLDGRGLWDLGNAALPLPGRLHLRLGPGATSPLSHPHTCCRRTESVDIQEDYLPDENGALQLPQGRHLLLWTENGALRGFEFRIESGIETEVMIPARG